VPLPRAAALSATRLDSRRAAAVVGLVSEAGWVEVAAAEVAPEAV
jgi:hypothetical protein